MKFTTASMLQPADRAAIILLREGLIVRLRRTSNASGNKQEAAKRLVSELRTWMEEAKEVLTNSRLNGSLQQRPSKEQQNIMNSEDSEHCSWIWCSFESVSWLIQTIAVGPAAVEIQDNKMTTAEDVKRLYRRFMDDKSNLNDHWKKVASTLFLILCSRLD